MADNSYEMSKHIEVTNPAEAKEYFFSLYDTIIQEYEEDGNSPYIEYYRDFYEKRKWEENIYIPVIEYGVLLLLMQRVENGGKISAEEQIRKNSPFIPAVMITTDGVQRRSRRSVYWSEYKMHIKPQKTAELAEITKIIAEYGKKCHEAAKSTARNTEVHAGERTLPADDLNRKPASGAMNNSSQHSINVNTDNASARQASDSIEAERDRIIAEARAEAGRIVAEAKAEASKKAEDIRKEAENKAREDAAKITAVAYQKSIDLEKREEIVREALSQNEQKRREAEEYAARVRREADEETARQRREAEVKAEDLRRKAEEEAEQYLQEKRAEADGILAEARENAVAKADSFVERHLAGYQKAAKEELQESADKLSMAAKDAAATVTQTRAELCTRTNQMQAQLMMEIDKFKTEYFRALGDWQKELSLKNAKELAELYCDLYMRINGGTLERAIRAESIAVMNHEEEQSQNENGIESAADAQEETVHFSSETIAILKKHDKAMHIALQKFEKILGMSGLYIITPEIGEEYNEVLHINHGDEEPDGLKVQKVVSPCVMRKTNFVGETGENSDDTDEVIVRATVILQ